MFVTAILFAYLSLVSLVFGVGVRRVLGLDGTVPAAALLATGMAVVSAAAGLASLAIPLNGFAHLALLAATIGVAVWLRVPVVAELRGFAQTWRSLPTWIEIGGVVATVVLLEHTADVTHSYDTGLYHAQSIRWMEEWGAVPGLGNLRVYFAQFQGWFVTSALFSLRALGLGPLHGLTGWLSWIFMLSALPRIARFVTGERTASTFLWGWLGTGRLLRFISLSAPATDMPAALLVWLTYLVALEALESEAKPARQAWDTHIAVIAILSGFALSVKLAALPVLAVSALLIAMRRASLWKSGLATFALVLPFMLISVIQSGYPLYPATALPLPADWRVPAHEVREGVREVKNWAWYPWKDASVAPRMEAILARDVPAWFPVRVLVWWAGFPTSEKRILVMFLICLPLAGVVAFRRRRATDFLLMTTVPGVVFWFAEAPNYRYSWIFLPLAASACLWLVVDRPVQHLKASICAIGWCGLVALNVAWAVRGMSKQAVVHHFILPEPYPVVSAETRRFNNLEVNIPRGGEECWDTPLPCANGLTVRLRRRGPSLGAGFTVAAPTSPRHMP